MSWYTMVETDEPDVQPGEAKLYRDRADGNIYVKTETQKIAVGGIAGQTQPPIPSGTGGDDAWHTATPGDYYFRTDIGRLFCHNGAEWGPAHLVVYPYDALTGVVTPSDLATEGRAVIYKQATNHTLSIVLHDADADVVHPLGAILTAARDNLVTGTIDILVSEGGVPLTVRDGVADLFKVDANAAQVSTTLDFQAETVGTGGNQWRFSQEEPLRPATCTLRVTVNGVDYRLLAEQVPGG